MQAKVKWIENRRFLGQSGTGHGVIMEGPGDDSIGLRPMEMILLGVGGCSSYDVINMLEKTRQDISDCYVEIEAERADAVPAVFTKIHLHFVVTGRDLKASAVQRAVSLSAEKYCSASIMLQSGGVNITHSYEIVEISQ